LLALNEALEELEKMDPRKAGVVEVRHFGGLSLEETAAVLKVTTRTVLRDWEMARAWLYQQLQQGAASG
jgi:RNA polymerase sigma-70 factor, ECF subfamily